MLIPDAAPGEPGQQFLPLLRRAERALERVPGTENAFFIVTVAGPSIGIGIGIGIGA